MGLYLLNISVDAIDPQPAYLPEDLSFNDQESIIEIVLEQLLGFENAIEEYDDHDTEDNTEKKNIKVDFLVHPNHNSSLNQSLALLKKAAISANDNQLSIGFLEVDSPPPKI